MHRFIQHDLKVCSRTQMQGGVIRMLVHGGRRRPVRQ